MKLNSGVKKQSRQRRALQRLISQEEQGVKPATKGRNGHAEVMMLLSETDKERIHKEIVILMQRVQIPGKRTYYLGPDKILNNIIAKFSVMLSPGREILQLL